MRIVCIWDSIEGFKSGCNFVRTQVPFIELKKRGHILSYAVLDKMEEEKVIRDNDILIFARYYNRDPRRFFYKAKAKGKKVVYEIDDDVWTIPPLNPATITFSKKEVQSLIEELLSNADLVTTTTEHLKKVLQKFNKKVVVCPNAISFDHFKERERKGDKLRIGYTCSVTHHEDIALILDVIRDLQKEYDFEFIIQGICSHPLLSEIYTYTFFRKQNWMPELNPFFDKGIEIYQKLQSMKSWRHVPFYMPELYPKILRDLDLDIGLCPLADNEFNRSKSCIKFYEYVGVGTVVLASNVLPYKNEVNYLADNNYKDWYKKLEKLIIDKDFREDLLHEQRKIVSQIADIRKVGDTWERVYKSLL